MSCTLMRPEPRVRLEAAGRAGAASAGEISSSATTQCGLPGDTTLTRSGPVRQGRASPRGRANDGAAPSRPEMRAPGSRTWQCTRPPTSRDPKGALSPGRDRRAERATDVRMHRSRSSPDLSVPSGSDREAELHADRLLTGHVTSPRPAETDVPFHAPEDLAPRGLASPPVFAPNRSMSLRERVRGLAQAQSRTPLSAAETAILLIPAALHS